MLNKRRSSDCTKSAVSLLTGTALLLPGLGYNSAFAAEDDEVDFQYSHYQEGMRDGINTLETNPETGAITQAPVPNKRNPIEVESLHGSGRFALTDRFKFAFNYIQDTWSGATPYGTAPEFSGANRVRKIPDAEGNEVNAGASPFIIAREYFDKQGNAFHQIFDIATLKNVYLKSRPVHVMGFASPETRKQGDFILSYDWDDAGIEVGGGISTESDYESRFVNLGGRMDFNQKQTTVSAGLSYTNSAINVVLDSLGDDYFRWGPQYEGLIQNNALTGVNTLHANREDWAGHVELTQVVNQNALLQVGASYTRSTGFLENPYKLSWIFGLDPDLESDGYILGSAHDGVFMEQRPDAHDQWHWNAGWTQFIKPFNAALHFKYSFDHDDWGINAHALDADWVQPLAYGWTITPHVRYYSQSAAYFYGPYIFTKSKIEGITETWPFVLPENFSSDQRLSGFGALSGGVVIEKKFAKGLSLEAGFEYYTHQGGLKLGGGGEQNFADFDYWVANAALKFNLSALGHTAPGGDHNTHDFHSQHPNIPASVLFGHSLDKAGDMMAGYRYMHSQQAGAFLHGDNSISEQRMLAKGCPGSNRIDDQGINHFDGGCAILPREMLMSMHMLDLMYAPTDWLTLMLMPQFTDMNMDNYQPESLIDPDIVSHSHGGGQHGHETGGVGDTGMFALVKLFDRPNHHIHVGLGISAPTGDVGKKLKVMGLRDLEHRDGAYVHYGMQLGSGTWDFKPSLTYTGKAGDWNWGGQLAGTKRIESSNSSGYRLGDIFEASVWGGYDFTHWLSGTVRMSYEWQGSINGRYPRSTRDDNIRGSCNRSDYFWSDDDVNPPYFHEKDYLDCVKSIEDSAKSDDARDRPTPMDFHRNYGGQYVDLGLGISATVPSGAFAGNRLAFEWLQPIYTNVNGYQLDRDGALSFTWSYGF